MTVLRILLLVLLACLSGLAAKPEAAGAYKIRPFPGVHEGMTVLAERCLVSALSEPSDCSSLSSALPTIVSWRGRPGRTYDELQKAVRWPDDPGRQIRSFGLPAFLGNSLVACERRVMRSIARTGAPPPFDSIGLLCSSHAGRLQFFHAMQSSAEDDPEATRAKILDWADVAFRVATGRVQPSETICSYFADHPTSISGAFEVANPQHCSWTFATIFGWRCSNPFSMRRCGQLRPGVLADQLAVRVARGALLHLIQDSYSQSHAVRGPVRREPTVDCSLPTQFYNYVGQSGHGRADFLPHFEDNCRGGDVDDPITASAMVLYHVARRTDPDDFNCYLQDRVFGRRIRWTDGARRVECRTEGRGGNS